MAVTLNTTTFTAPVSPNDSSVLVGSVANIVPGQCLFADRELMQVVSIGLATSASTALTVIRGIAGTAATLHSSGLTVIIGNPDQFYEMSPVGPPPADVLVTPWVNVVNGSVWVAQGDESGPDAQARWWAQSLISHDVGPLGVRTWTATIASTTNN